MRRILGWEGALIDPIGGILGAVVFSAVAASTHDGPATSWSSSCASIGIGGPAPRSGIALLWLLLRRCSSVRCSVPRRSWPR